MMNGQKNIKLQSVVGIIRL